MANNRLYLVHKESKTCVGLAKHMGQGWYCSDETMNHFFNINYNHCMDKEDSIESYTSWERLYVMMENEIDFNVYKKIKPREERKWFQFWK